MNKYIEKINREIKSLNVRKKVKLRIRKKKSDRYSLYLDLWKDGKRSYEYLNRYIGGTKDSVISDNEALRFAISYRDRREDESNQEGKSLKSNKGKILKANFVEYFYSLVNEKEGTTKKKWFAVYKHLDKFTNSKATIESIDTKFCKTFYNYLNRRFNHSTPKVYYKVFSAALNQLVWDEIITSNPAKKAAKNPEIKHKLMQNKERPREFLSLQEITKLVKTPNSNRQTRNAFIFSCFTGLRLEDIIELPFKAINEGYLYFRQIKTREDDRMKLHPVAIKIINEQKKIAKNQKKVFNLFDNKAVNRHIKNWVEKAGIDKHISFHCARHSFATIGLTNDIDIFTLSKLLGHKDITSTMIYAKLIDKKKDEAIDKIPIL